MGMMVHVGKWQPAKSSMGQTSTRATSREESSKGEKHCTRHQASQIRCLASLLGRVSGITAWKSLSRNEWFLSWQIGYLWGILFVWFPFLGHSLQQLHSTPSILAGRTFGRAFVEGFISSLPDTGSWGMGTLAGEDDKVRLLCVLESNRSNSNRCHIPTSGSKKWITHLRTF